MNQQIIGCFLSDTDDNYSDLLSLHQHNKQPVPPAIQKALFVNHLGGSVLAVTHERPQTLELDGAPSEAADDSMTVTAQPASNNEPWSGQSLTEEKCPATIFSERVARGRSNLEEFEENFRVDPSFTVADNPSPPLSLMVPTGSSISSSAVFPHVASFEGVALHVDSHVAFQIRNDKDILVEFEDSFSSDRHTTQ